MTLSMIGAARFPQAFPLARLTREPSAQAAGHKHAPESATSEQNRPTLNQPGEIQRATESRSLAALRFKSQLKIKQGDDGQTEIKFKSQLKFNYEFQSEDGTTIRLAAKVKTRFSLEQSNHESEASFELKARVKMHLSLVQQSVGSGLEPVLNAEQSDAPHASAIESALSDFSSLVDQLSNRFLNNTVGGDDLIGELVNAFNDLTQLVQTQLPQQAGTTLDSPASPSLVQTARPQVDAVIPVPSSDQQDVASKLTPTEDTAPAVSVIPPAIDPPIEPIGDNTAPSQVATATEDKTATAAETVDAPREVARPAASNVTSDRSMLVDLRLRFVQSLTRLVSEFDSSSDDTNGSFNAIDYRARAKLDLRIAAYSQLQLSNLIPPGINVDADA